MPPTQGIAGLMISDYEAHHHVISIGWVLTYLGFGTVGDANLNTSFAAATDRWLADPTFGTGNPSTLKGANDIGDHWVTLTFNMA